MHTSEVLVRVEGLERRYGETLAVAGVSFEVHRGEVLGLLGPNGAGKSTAMQIIAGALAPSAGQVQIDGLDILDHPIAAKGRIGYLPEQPPLYRELTVDEYLRYCARLHRVPRGEVAAALTRARERCGLEAMGHRLIGNLSKGYQQRVGIAQAIIHNPAVVILDEPTVGLDPIQIREIRQLIRELGGEHSVILSTHILPEVQAVCDRVQIIHRGRLVLNEDLKQLEARSEAELLVRFTAPPAAAALEQLPGVARVEARDDGAFLLHLAAGANPAPRMVEDAVAGGWGLVELSPRRRTLEEIFVQLTAGDDGGHQTPEVAA
ncbi:MAG: ATP-binding cassette domain-containing protein [Gammaproteobacteria bacterium]|nr:ATP-binding cassette domain-containing protein [Gammaproteobacteria bacterium]